MGRKKWAMGCPDNWQVKKAVFWPDFVTGQLSGQPVVRSFRPNKWPFGFWDDLPSEIFQWFWFFYSPHYIIFLKKRFFSCSNTRTCRLTAIFSNFPVYSNFVFANTSGHKFSFGFVTMPQTLGSLLCQKIYKNFRCFGKQYLKLKI